MDYKNGKIYRLVCGLETFYVGSTTMPLYKRLYCHKVDFMGGKYSHRYTIVDDWNNVEIVLIEAFSCSSKNELHSRERYWIEELKPQGNKCIPCRTAKEYHIEYYQANKEDQKKKGKDYYEANKDIINEKNKAYREANKEKLKKKGKDYYEANKDIINEKRKAYREANKEKLKKIRKDYYEANKDIINEKKKEYYIRKKEEEASKIR